MITNQKYPVRKQDLPVRLDKFLCSRFPHLSRSLIVHAIEAEEILVNGAPVLKGRKLKENDEVLVRRLIEGSDIRVIPNDKIKLDIIHEDDDILVINKPAGIPVHPIKPDETGTLANGLIARYPGLADVGDDPLFPAFVHRIDTDTSGIVVAAKNDEAYQQLRKQFQEKKVKKIYLALVRGDVVNGASIDNYLIHDPKDNRKMQAVKSPLIKGDKGGCKSRLLRAITLYKPLKRFGTRTLLEVEIKTGVMHQIRCHMADIGHPVMGDKIYGDKKVGKRHLLHAQKIGFSHPATGKQIQFEAAPSDDFKKHLTK